MRLNENKTIKKLTCICCPLGCPIEVEWDPKGKIVCEITGNTCQKGAEYARSECIYPKRIVTSTMMSDRESLVPVKTDQPIPKEKIFDCMELINSTMIHLPVAVGDVVIENVFGSNIVVTAAHD